MQALNAIRGLDLYLLDQLLKGNIPSSSRMLDAGCGSGRNLHLFVQNGYNLFAFDPNEEAIQALKAVYPRQAERFTVSTIEDFTSPFQFDFIICNAVLHFASSHEVFFHQFQQLTFLLSENGILFIRMTSLIGLEADVHCNELGRALLPDGSERYLLTHQTIHQVCSKFQLEFVEPLKTVNVNNLRCMSNLILRKSPSLH